MLFPLFSSRFYLAEQLVLGATGARRLCIQDYLDARPGQRVLDIGCGPGYISDYLPEVDYVGFDTDQRHIDYARKRYGHRGQFYCQEFTAALIPEVGRFDRVMLMGLLHHLDDAQALTCLSLTRQVLKPGGRLVSMDGVYCPKQSPITRLLLRLDKGKFVRTKSGYLALASQAFSTVTSFLRHDMFYVPYSLIIMDCRL